MFSFKVDRILVIPGVNRDFGQINDKIMPDEEHRSSKLYDYDSNESIETALA